MELGSSFGPKLKLTTRLREILAIYPAGVSVLRELLQNADDAGAATLALCLDKREFDTDSLAFPGLAPFQGPALLAYNDAVFSDADFESIQRVGDSGKASLRTKTGRFGIGFCAVYHLTEVPSFVSRSKLVYFDPSLRSLPRVSAADPGTAIDMTDPGVADALSSHASQFAPYALPAGALAPGQADYDPLAGSNFDGTLFRLPLRTEDQAAASELSKEAFTSDDILQLFDDFAHDAHNMLLFLKHVACVNLLVWEAGASAPSLLVSLTAATRSLPPELPLPRHPLTLLPPSASPRSLLNQVVGSTPTAWIEASAASTTVAYVLDVTVARSGSPDVTTSLLILQGLTGGQPLALATDETLIEFGFTFLPLVGLALPLHRGCLGRAFCTLPLPTHTGLAFHINGAFELSSNRRDIWHGLDLTGLGKTRADWNNALITEGIPPLLSLGLALVSRPGLSAHRLLPADLLPEPTSVHPPWSSLLAPLASSTLDPPLPLFVPDNPDAGLVALPDARLLPPSVPADSPLALAIAHCVDDPAHMVTTSPPHLLRLLACSPATSAAIEKATIAPAWITASVLPLRPRYPVSEPGVALLAWLAATPGLDLSGDGPLFPLASGEFSPLPAQGAYIAAPNSPEALLLAALLPERSVASAVEGTDVFDMLTSLTPDRLGHRLVVVAGPGDLPQRDLVAVASASPDAVLAYMKVRKGSATKLAGAQVVPVLAATDRYPVPSSLATSRLVLPPHAASLLANQADLPRLLLSLGLPVAATRSGLTGLAHEFSFDGLARAASVAPSDFAAAISTLSASDANTLRSLLADLKTSTHANLDSPHTADFAASLIAAPMWPHIACGGGTQLGSLGAHFLVPPATPSALLAPSCLAPLPASVHGLAVWLAPFVEQLDSIGVIARAFVPWLADLLSADEAVPLPGHIDVGIRLALENVDALRDEYPVAVDILASLPFVLRAGGDSCARARANELYDPQSDESQLAVLLPPNHFPAEGYTAPIPLHALRRLGLRSRLTPDAVVAAAKSAAADQACDRGSLLLEYLAVQPRLVSSLTEHQLTALRSTPWLPVAGCPPNDLPWLPWRGAEEARPTAAPRDVVPPQLAAYASVSRFVLDSHRSLAWPRHVVDALGWPGGAEDLDSELVVAQLVALGQLQAPDLAHAGAALARIVPHVYALLASALGEASAPRPDWMERLCRPGIRWIFQGSAFVEAGVVAFSAVTDLRPLRYVVPADMVPFGPLFVAAGVPPAFPPRVYLEVLAEVASAGPTAWPISLERVTAILIHLASIVHTLTPDERGAVLLPDTRRRLVPAASLTANDAQWVESGSGALPDGVGAADVVYVHDGLATSVALALGAKSLRALLWARASDHMALAAVNAEEFSQSQSLTHTISGVLDLYPFGLGLLHELVQNANDAGASEVVFCLDLRNHPRDKLLADSMAELQGPALLVYNDAPFTDADYAAIASIGQGAKAADAAATGKFGLGVCATYHVTDTLTFVSGSSLVVFDPHGRHLPSASAGIRLRLDPGLASMFPDQFAPFCVLGHRLDAPLDGTLFRLPLRTSVQARDSAFGGQVSPRAILDLFAAFEAAPDAAGSLLFLSSVSRLSFRVFADAPLPSQAQQALVVAAGFPHADLHGAGELFAFSRAALKASPLSAPGTVLAPGGSLVVPPPARASRAAFARWLQTIEQQPGHSMLAGHAAAAGILAHSLATMSLVHAPSGSTTAFAVASAVGGVEATRLAVEQANAKQRGVVRLVPFAQVAIPLASSGNEVTEACSRVFVGLPLPLHSGLPLWMSASFEVSSNRRELWSASQTEQGVAAQRAAWNAALLRGLLPFTASLALVGVVLSMGPNPLPGDIVARWPHRLNLASEAFAPMIDAMYVDLLPVLPLFGDDRSILHPSFVLVESEAFEAVSNSRVARVVASLGYTLVPIPSAVLASLGPTANALSPGLVRAMLREHGSKRVAGALVGEMSETDELVGYLMSDLIPLDLVALPELMGLPLLQLLDGRVETIAPPPTTVVAVSVPSLRLAIERAAAAGGIGVVDASVVPPQLHDVLAWLAALEPQAANLVWAENAEQLRYVLARGLDTAGDCPQLGSEPWLSRAWVDAVWCGVEDAVFASRSVLFDLPLVIAHDGLRLVAMAQPGLCDGSGMDEDVCDALRVLGLTFAEPGLLAAHGWMSGHMASCELGSIATALDAVTAGWAESDWQASPKREAALEVVAEYLLSALALPVGAKTLAGSAALSALVTRMPLVTIYGADGVVQRVALCGVDAVLPPASVCDATLLGSLNADSLATPSGSRPRVFVVARSAAERGALGALGVTILNETRFYREVFLPQLASSSQSVLAPELVRSEQMRVLLARLPSLVEEAPLVEQLRRTPLVATRSGTLVTAAELYHPDARMAAPFLDAKSQVPGPEFSSPEVLAGLAVLGLRPSADVDAAMTAARQLAAAEPDAVSLERAVELFGWLGRVWPVLMGESEPDSTDLSDSFSDSDDDGGEWSGSRNSPSRVLELLDIAWLPLDPNVPHPFLPRCDAGSSGRAPPTACKPPGVDSWALWSGSHAVAHPSLGGDVLSRAPKLCDALGWSAPPTGASLVLQLQGMARMLTEECVQWDGIEDVLDKVYNALADLPPRTQPAPESVAKLPVVWLGDGGFVPPLRCALSPGKELAAEGVGDLAPWLWVVPTTLPTSFVAAYQVLGVPAHFAPAALVACTDAVAASVGDGGILAERELDLMLGVLRALGGAIDEGLELDEVFVPTVSHRVVAASRAYVNDAQWLDPSALAAKEAEGAFYVVHAKVPASVVAASVSLSLRNLLTAHDEATTQLRCPGSAELAPLAALWGASTADGLFRVATDLMLVADAMGARKARLVLDARHHASVSLLQPGLAAGQGPALVLLVPGVELDLSLLGEFMADPRVGTVQRGLLRRAFVVGPLVQVLFGSTLALFDPSGECLTAELGPNDNAGSSGSSRGQATAYEIHNSKVVTRFPDQFAPFGVLGLAPSRRVGGTVIRVPLAGGVANSAALAVLAESLAARADSMLVFLRSVADVRTVAVDEDGETSQVFRVSLAGGEEQLARRNALFTSTQWVGWRMLAFQPTRLDVSLGIRVVRPEAGEPEMVQWRVVALVGAGGTRAMARDKANASLGLYPMGAVAARVSPGPCAGEMVAPLALGAGRQEAGLPVLVSGGFVVDPLGSDVVWTDRVRIGAPSSLDVAELVRIAEFNAELLTQNVVGAYAMLLESLASQAALAQPETYYGTWPSDLRDPRLERQLRGPLYTAMVARPVWKLASSSASWVTADQGMLVEDGASAGVVDFGAKFFALHDLPPGLSSQVARQLRQTGGGDVQFLTPQALRRVLTADGLGMAHFDSMAQVGEVLAFVVSDVLGNDREGPLADALASLEGVRVLATMGGTLEAFADLRDDASDASLIGSLLSGIGAAFRRRESAKAQERVAALEAVRAQRRRAPLLLSRTADDDHYRLLPVLGSWVNMSVARVFNAVLDGLDPCETEGVALEHGLGVTFFSPDVLARLAPSMAEVPVEGEAATPAAAEWVQLVWAYLVAEAESRGEQAADVMGDLEALPLLPLRGEQVVYVSGSLLPQCVLPTGNLARQGAHWR
ncbi:sacs protein [Thecamonas trahens ATCC 50062]|uniref:Sacs protein n=1 Tax=Thecamonas trahens ATCC 50062 TaxID=461836 RepID=A0A0L0DIM9_THETB|nr:sacs protein [Thecamonas trahens ATCC 50062]KNC52147.1 sacs protein [Thecamonas trahens ATCC 50062]|eukprot:XP_013762150.1 sacs protein [Thecamonas trahens ATCC 50062]